MSNEGNRWWEAEIPRLRVLIEDLGRRLDKMGFFGTERQRVLGR